MPDKRSQANSHSIDRDLYRPGGKLAGMNSGPRATAIGSFPILTASIGTPSMPFPFVPIVLGSHLLIATTSGIPSVDIRKSCQAAAGTMADLIAGSTVQHDLDVCLGSEQAAREQLIKNWTTYSSAEKTQCVQPSVYLPSYIEWLTCLEMEMSVRRPDTKPP